MKHTWSVTGVMLCLFFLTQILGLFILDQSSIIIDGKLSFKDISIGDYTFERPETSGTETVGLMALAILLGTGLIFLIMKLKWHFLWKLWFFAAIFGCLTFAFSALLPYPYPFLLAFLLAVWRLHRPNFFLHNFTELFIYPGLALIFVPLLTINAAIAMLLLISVYDMYAVWQSKHMVKLAKFQTKQGNFAGMVVPYALPKKAKGKTKKVSVATAILGGGDLGFPLFFAGAVYTQYGLPATFIIPVCAVISLGALLTYGKKNRFYPAMPYLSVGCFVGFALLKLVVV